MTNGRATSRLIDGVLDWLDALHSTEVQVELAIAVGLLGIAWFIGRRLRAKFGEDSVRERLARHLLPSTVAWMTFGIAGFSARHLDFRSTVFAVMGQMAFAMLLIRTIELALRQVFARSSWLKGVERYLAALVWIVVALDLIGLLSDIIVWLDSFSFHVGHQRVSMWSLIQGGLTVAVTMVSAMWAGGVIEERLLKVERMDLSTRVVMSRIVRALLAFFGVLVAMSLAGLDLTTLSVFSGALGVGLGFGMQKIASNYVSGFIILLDRSIRIGNMISVAGDRGEVQEITTRYTVLRSPNGINVIVPNETLIASTVQNETYADKNIWISIKIQVGYSSDVERALLVLEECALIHPRVLREPKPTAFLANFGDSGIDLELGFWIFDPAQGSLGVKSAINREILRRFRDEGIEIPFPQREIRVLNAGFAPSPG
ncbi:mechanosensitive ion channel family protein [Niveibacterium terrae]|uniref:mechanosensitive ion channel family protein n=1 Tax=Niveibacterium terrae TaxID=3373598 RepID=UPI003A9048E0